MSVTGVSRKPALAESGASVSVGGDIWFRGTARLGDSVLPDDAGELTWYWVLDGEPQVYYEIVGEYGIPKEYHGERPYALYLSPGMIGCSLSLRVRAANYSGFLESGSVTVGKCPTAIAGLPACYEGKVNAAIRLRDVHLTEISNTNAVVRNSAVSLSLRNADGVECDFPSNDGNSYAVPDEWTPTERGEYTLHIEYAETERYLGASCDVPVRVFPADRRVKAGRNTFTFSFGGQGVSVSVVLDDWSRCCAAFFGEDGRFLGCGFTGGANGTAFTVPDAQNADRVLILTMNDAMQPVAAAERLSF